MQRMVGRDPDEAHGSATPLEPLFDLTFVVAFGVAGEQFAHLANSVMVSGYIVMRVAMVFQWLRAAKHDPTHRPAALTYAVTLVIAQVGWVAVVIAPLTLEQVFAVAAVLMLLELSGTVIAERIKGGTPWHVHHIVERHGLLVIITLGEGVIGTVASLAAVGAGLHVAAYYIEHVAHVGAVATVLTVAIPVAVFTGAIYLLYAYLVRVPDPFHLILLVGTGATLVLAVVIAAQGVSMAWCLIVVMLAPVVTVVGYEWVGHAHEARALDISLGRADPGRDH